jgi:hypothetical protein
MKRMFAKKDTDQTIRGRKKRKKRKTKKNRPPPNSESQD